MFSTNKSGNFIALKVGHPKLADGAVQVIGTDGTSKAFDADGILIWKVTKDGRGRNYPIKITAQGITYTIDLTELTEEKAISGLSVKPVAETVKPFESDAKNVTAGNLQDALSIEDNNDRTFTVTGTAKYIKGWSAFSTVPDHQTGYFIALDLSADVDKWDEIKVKRVEEQDWTALSGNGIVVLKLDRVEGGTTYANKIEVEVNGTPYTIDFSKVERGANDRPDVKAMTGSLAGWGSKKIADLQNITGVTFDEATSTYTVSGELYYNNWNEFSSVDSLKKGYYVALDLTPMSGSGNGQNLEYGDVKILSRDSGEGERTWKPCVGDYNVFWYVSNGTTENQALSVQAFGKEFTVEFDMDKIVKASAEALSGDTGLDDGDGADIFANDLQSGINVTKDGNTFIVTGTAKYIDTKKGTTGWKKWFSSVEAYNDGYFVVLNFELGDVKGSDIKIWGDWRTDWLTLTDGDYDGTLTMCLRAFDPMGSSSGIAKIKVGNETLTIDMTGLTDVDGNPIMGSGISAAAFNGDFTAPYADDMFVEPSEDLGDVEDLNTTPEIDPAV